MDSLWLIDFGFSSCSFDFRSPELDSMSITLVLARQLLAVEFCPSGKRKIYLFLGSVT